MKKVIHRSSYDFLKNEFKYLESTGNLQEGQADKLIALYEYPNEALKPSKKINMISILLTIGALLIGLGILSFIASNWSNMTSSTKYVSLLAILIGFFITARLLENKRPYIAKAFYYIGVFAFGGELFYIGQLFHLGGKAENTFIWWGLGTLPLAFYCKDKILKAISLIFIYVFIELKFIHYESDLWYLSIFLIPLLFLFGHFIMKKNSKIMLLVNMLILFQFIQTHFYFRTLAETASFPWIFIVLIPPLFYVGHKFLNKSIILFTINTFMVIQAIVTFFVFYEMENIILLLVILFVLGLAYTHIRHKDYELPMKVIGSAVHFITAIMLTIPFLWEESFPKWATTDTKALIPCIVIGVLYSIYALSMASKGNLFGVAIVCVFILRFYVDLSLQFMNKSIAFLIGGILLIALGIWFERTRKGGKKNDPTFKE
ncbi:DUF2157 domain-containing protein [Bacillus sp. JJ1773]|uniref:DUF2157 domain-containing protein n=1 Tax=Bacillus sp. JJ1773 TaxID=3122965 RepID=UPI002FFE465C